MPIPIIKITGSLFGIFAIFLIFSSLSSISAHWKIHEPIPNECNAKTKKAEKIPPFTYHWFNSTVPNAALSDVIIKYLLIWFLNPLFPGTILSIKAFFSLAFSLLIYLDSYFTPPFFLHNIQALSKV